MDNGIDALKRCVVLVHLQYMTRKELIRKNKALFWYIPEKKKEDISDSLLVETLLNYGSLNDVKELFDTLGIDRVAKVFYSVKGRQKGNYSPVIYNYFSLVFNRYAPQGNTK